MLFRPPGNQSRLRRELLLGKNLWIGGDDENLTVDHSNSRIINVYSLLPVFGPRGKGRVREFLGFSVANRDQERQLSQPFFPVGIPTTTMTMPGPNFKRGQVVLVLCPNSDLRTAKTRPALVVQADGLDTGLSQVIVAMITSRLFRARHPSRVLVELSTPAGENSGLLGDSVVTTDNLAMVTAASIDRVVGLLDMAEVDAALRHTLNF